MYPGTIIEYVDQSVIEPITIETVANRPLLFALFTSDKGPESFQRVYGKDFFNLYGDSISFEKHGQPLLQAAMSINAGAELFCKRIVAPNSTLANRSIIAKIYKPTEGNIVITHYPFNPGMAPTDAQTLSQSTLNRCNELMLTKAQTEDVYKALEGTLVYTNKDLDESHLAKSVEDLTDSEGRLIVVGGKVVNYGGNEGANANSWYFTVSSTTYYVNLYNEYGQVQLEDVSNEHWFPLVAITDNGRGVSTKSYDIKENSKLSKNTSFAVYDIEVHEGLNVSETIHFSMDPSAISGTTSMSLNEQARSAVQFDAYQDSEQFDALIECISGYTGKTKAQIVDEDFVFARTRAGQGDLSWMGYNDGGDSTNIEHIIHSDAASDPCININDYTNLGLIGGSNGSFGNRPINAATYASAMASVFSIDSSTGVEAYPEIYDLDQHKIMAIIDANYPNETGGKVKDSLAEFAAIREDCVFLRDMGTTGLDTATAIETAAATVTNKSKFTALYCQYYDIKDPYTYKQITVTIGYSLVRLLINQFNNGISLPLAGQKYGVTIPEAIYGTLNFAPLNLPSGNQKEAFDDLRLNYASYFGDLLVIETEYNTYEKFSQFSYLNNILGIQEAIRAVRTRCPLIRYSFITGGDFDAYQADVNAVLANYTNNFVSLELEYLGDDTYVANKIFYAAIKVRFKDFVQTEWFKVIALGTNSEA